MSKIYSAVITVCDIRCILVIWCGIPSLLFSGCMSAHGTINNQPIESGRLVTMDLISNVPNSLFRFRKQRLDIDPDEGWQTIGVRNKSNSQT